MDEPVNDTISIEQFAKARLRVATVVEARPHPNADKLMVLRVDLGEEGKHALAVVAGIKAHYNTPESLVGTQVIVVTNLPPATLRGEVSEAMLLAASDGKGSLSLLRPDKPMLPGSEVR